MNRATTRTETDPVAHAGWQELLHRRRPLPSGILVLPESGTWSLELAAPAEIRLLSGTAWITQEGDVEDHVVEAPGAFVARARGRVALMALSPVQFAVVPALRRAA